MFYSQARSKSIGVSPTIQRDSQLNTVMERKLTQANTSKTSFALRIWRAWLIDLTILRKINMAHTSENHWVQAIREFMTGLRKPIMETCSLVFLVKALTAQRKWFSHKMYIWMKLMIKKDFIEKLTATMPLENKNREITIGNLIQQNTDLGMEKKEFLTELQKHWNLRDTMMISQKPWLLKRPLKISKAFHQTYWAFPKISDKDKLQDQTTYTVSKTFKATILGTLPDVSMENQTQEKLNQTEILENQ